MSYPSSRCLFLCLIGFCECSDGSGLSSAEALNWSCDWNEVIRLDRQCLSACVVSQPPGPVSTSFNVKI